MKKWTVEQVEAARVNDRELRDCDTWMVKILDECPHEETLKYDSEDGWVSGWNGCVSDYTYRISQNWPSADQIEDAKPAKPTPAEFSTQYTLDGKPYFPEDDETELQRLIDGRDDLNDGIKVIRARRRRFSAFVAKQEGVKG